MDGQAVPSGQDDATISAPEPNVEPDVVPNAVLKEADMTVDVVNEVVNKIGEAHNILVALSSDPSVDEMAAAIGLSIYLDKLGKRATAIYSGSTPNALEFLKPEETFEESADTLQDFVIALNKEKADHLRYKLDGDYVKIFITPYRARLSDEDLEFSYGDFNVDLVLALDVANGIDLDSALREHGRIMHDAVIINITTGNPGKFGEIEWSDKRSSSVSEMVARLLYSINGKVKVEKEEATAFLTGIVAATNRFSGANTTANTMKIASRLMESGANQQLISKNITPDVENEIYSLLGDESIKKSDDNKLDIKHGNEEVDDEFKEIDADVNERESTLLDDLKAAEASLAQAGAEATPEITDQPYSLDGTEPAAPEPIAEPVAEPITEPVPSPESVAEPVAEPVAPVAPVLETTEPAPEMPAVVEAPFANEQPVAEPVAASSTVEADRIPTIIDIPGTTPVAPVATPETAPVAEATTPAESTATIPGTESFVSDKPEKILQPSAELISEQSSEGESMNKYGQMLEEALASVSAPAPTPATSPVSSPVASPVAQPMPQAAPMPEAPAVNPAAMNAPAVPTAPEINGVPEMNYMPMPGDEILPPPPAPPIMSETDSLNPVIVPPTTSASAPAPTNPIAPTESLPTPTQAPASDPATDPGAFKIPGM